MTTPAQITADGWIHIVPKGELFNAEVGVTQVLDDKALDSILANLTDGKKRLGDKWPGLYGGVEHHIYDPDQSSAALAWFKDFEKRADGIWANENGLTDDGRAAIAGKRFKYTSFCADPEDLEPLDGNRARVLKVETIGFTNQANGKELLTPITNRKGSKRSSNPDADAAAEFLKLAGDYRVKNRCTWPQALSATAKASPELVSAIPENDPFSDIIKKACIRNRQTAAGEFTKAVADYQATTGVSFSAALSHVQKTNPNLYQNAFFLP